MCNAFYCRVQKSNFNDTKFALFGDKYLSQDLIVILRNITRSPNASLLLAHRLRPWLSCKTALAKGLIFAGNTGNSIP